MPRLAALVAIFVALCSACTTANVVTVPGMKAFELSLATSADRMAVAWHGGVTGHDAIYIQWLDGQGALVDAPKPVTDGQRYAYEPDLQLATGDPLLVWYEKDPIDGHLSAWLARTDANGGQVWKQQLGSPAAQVRNPVVRVSERSASVAWIETPAGGSPAVWAARYGVDGRVELAPRIVGEASKTTWNLNATIGPDGAFYLVYDAQLDMQAKELQLLVIDGEATRAIALSSDDGFASVYPDIAINERGYAALTWFDAKDGNEEVYLAVMPLADLLSRKPPPLQRITHTEAASIGAYLAWNSAQLGLVWCDAEEGQNELYTQTFDERGNGSEVRRLSHTQLQSSIPSIRPLRAGFGIAWNEYLLTGSGAHRDVVSSEARVTIIP